jgi:FMN-dependent oxidoreductase (nitrilotriacetate monooxygenase family)
VKKRPLLFNAFTMNCVSHITHGLWTHPETTQRDYMHAEPWIELAKLLERARFDAVFIADVIGVYDNFRGSRDTAVRVGLQIPSNDPSLIIPVMAGATEHLGFAFTSSILQEHPFNFARRVSTLDHLTHGRIAWNIVTSYLNNSARNFGHEGLLPHDERYRWAQEYLDVTYKLWEGSWEDDAVVCDLARGIYSDPEKVHAINHVGDYFRVAGPHLCEPSPQRTPVIYQAGSSEMGRTFAARNAEATFLVAPTREIAAGHVEDIRNRAVAAGRRADDIVCVQGVTIVVGSTEEEAKRKSAEIDASISLEGLLVHMSGNIGVDLSAVDPSRPIGDLRPDELRVQGVQSLIDGSNAPKTQTFGELALLLGRGLRIVGAPEQIAHELQAWANVGIDGFNLMYATTPGTFADFVDHVVPLLQKRGLMQTEYRPGTLREKLFPGRGPSLPDRHPARAYRRLFHGRPDERRADPLVSPERREAPASRA